MKRLSKNVSAVLPIWLAFVLANPGMAMIREAADEDSPGTPQTVRGAATNAPPRAEISRGIAEILRLADAGVSAEVMKVYVECSPILYHPTDADVVALKKHNVPDEVVTFLLKQGVQRRAAVVRAREEAVKGALAERTRSSGGLDPESYEYFQYYYLQPRALASAYGRLAPYYGYGYLPYPSGFPPNGPFRRPLH